MNSITLKRVLYLCDFFILVLAVPRYQVMFYFVLIEVFIEVSDDKLSWSISLASLALASQ